jgi:hypothetical protein
MQILDDRVAVVDDEETGILIQEACDSGLYSVHMVSNQPIASVILHAKLTLVEEVCFPETETAIPRDRYLRMVSQYDYDELGKWALYFNMTPVDEQHAEWYRISRRIVSATY